MACHEKSCSHFYTRLWTFVRCHTISPSIKRQTSLDHLSMVLQMSHILLHWRSWYRQCHMLAPLQHGSYRQKIAHLEVRGPFQKDCQWQSFAGALGIFSQLRHQGQWRWKQTERQCLLLLHSIGYLDFPIYEYSLADRGGAVYCGLIQRSCQWIVSFVSRLAGREKRRKK